MTGVRGVAGLILALAMPAAIDAHDGPPFPIASDRPAGPYRVSIWTDPDTTDDGSPGGQFWVTLDPLATGTALPQSTRATLLVRPVDRPGPERRAIAAPVRGDTSNQFAGVVMAHEGRFAVTVTIAGPLGTGRLEAEVAATYDLRPAPILLALYLAPFVLVGLLWTRLVLRRRAAGQRGAGP